MTLQHLNAFKTKMKLETDLKIIKDLSKKNNQENWNFRSFLKSYDATIEEVDSIVHKLYQRISSEIGRIIYVQFILTAQKIVNHILICIRKNLFSGYGVSWRTVLFARLSLMSMNNSKVNSGIPGLFHSIHEKMPTSIKGLDGMYLLKRLSDKRWEERK